MLKKKGSRCIKKAMYNTYTSDESWFYAYEPETKQQSIVWVFQNEPNSTIVVRTRISKQMVACFFSIIGHEATLALQQRRTVNSEWHTTIYLPEFIGKIRGKKAEEKTNHSAS
ncbi:HTH_48 domain-containing protein [Trichonephila clavipes]|uniref:HTH_48 domain-containing protein n=1 Tax=Trichonephila clavipes TaxID=2585209 RepID=A0A8X6RYB9_TRICX|nr:HTH_48 domain-containing protein [Trichonephila clavipes]